MIKVQGVFRVLTVLSVLLALSLVPVQASTGGKIAGVVTDATTGDALPNANIIVVDSEMGTTFLYPERADGYLYPTGDPHRLRADPDPGPHSIDRADIQR